MEGQSLNWLLIVGAIFFLTIAYQFGDLYPRAKSFRLYTVLSYYGYLGIIFILNLIAAYLLSLRLKSEFLLIILSVFGTLSILQSLTLKVAEIQLIDFESLVDRLRLTIISDARKKVSKKNRTLYEKTRSELIDKYRGREDVQRLRSELATLLPDQKGAEILNKLAH